MPSQETDTPEWMRRQRDAGGGAGRFEQATLDQGLLLVHSDFHPRQALVEQAVRDGEAGGLVITIGLQGRSGYVGHDGAQLRFEQGHTTVSAFRQGCGERRFEAGQRVAQLRVLIDEHALARYGHAHVLPAHGVRPLAFASTTRAGASLAALLARSLLKKNDALAMHIGVLSLLAEQLRPLQPAPLMTVRWSDADIRKIERAHALMEEQMAQELTLAYLCAQVGLSLFRFKQGWRHRYGDSPHRTLLALRMQRAKWLLESGCQVAQAGWQVGYRHPANFSTAFSRYFGYAPKTVGRAGV